MAKSLISNSREELSLQHLVLPMRGFPIYIVNLIHIIIKRINNGKHLPQSSSYYSLRPLLPLPLV